MSRKAVETPEIAFLRLFSMLQRSASQIATRFLHPYILNDICTCGKEKPSIFYIFPYEKASLAIAENRKWKYNKHEI